MCVCLCVCLLLSDHNKFFFPQQLLSSNPSPLSLHNCHPPCPQILEQEVGLVLLLVPQWWEGQTSSGPSCMWVASWATRTPGRSPSPLSPLVVSRTGKGLREKLSSFHKGDLTSVIDNSITE